MRVPFSYLERQFADVDAYLADIRTLVQTCDFTLGQALAEFEARFAALHQAPFAVGVGTGTDALAMSLKVHGIGPGDEVITCANTFVATVGAIAQVGATPVLVDSENGYVIDPDQIEAAVTPRTRAIIPVHYTGNLADMPRIMPIAHKRSLLVVEDACQAILGAISQQSVGSWGATAGFSLHPLKNLNVWGDGGILLTHSADLAERLRRFRNHGLVNRDVWLEFGVNCRLDTLQAVVGCRLLCDLERITSQRIANARRYDEALADIPEIDIPARRPEVRHVFHLYVLRVERRDELLAYLQQRGVEAKVHYPIAVHLQPALQHLGYRAGDFPVAEDHTRRAITLPAHQHLTGQEIEFTIDTVRKFYGKA